MKNRTLLSILLSGLILFFYSCDNTEENPDSPELPPMESMLLDFSAFSNDNIQGLKKSENLEPGSYTSYLNALGNLAFWNATVVVTLAVPVASYAAALTGEPEYLGDLTWQWEFEFNQGASTYSARLVASRLNNEEYSSRMYITKTGVGAFEEFMWYEGIARFDRTHSVWTLYESPANPVELLEIEWSKDWETLESESLYTIVESGSAEFGSSLSFNYVEGDGLNAQYVISASGNRIDIEWNTTSLEGRIKNPAFFSDNEWHCWDESLKDKDC